MITLYKKFFQAFILTIKPQRQTQRKERGEEETDADREKERRQIAKDRDRVTDNMRQGR